MRLLFWKRQVNEDDPLEDMDAWTRSMVTKLVPPLLVAEPISDEQLAPPVGAGDQATNTLLDTGKIEFKNLKRDTSCGKFPLGQWAKLKIMQTLMDIEDIYVTIDPDDVADVLKASRLIEVLPKANVPWENPTADAGLTRMAFYGLASHRVVDVPDDEEDAPEGAAFKVDVLAMNKYELRDGFALYGACAYFKKDQTPAAIRTAKGELVYPTGGYKWEVAKFAWRSSILTLVTAVDHLFGLHFCVAAQLLRALTEAFPADHPIKRSLGPFLFRTALINNKAGTALLPENSILHHITSFTWDSMVQLADDHYLKGPEWMPLKKFVASKGPGIGKLIEDGKLPFYQDGLELYDCFYHFFEQVVPATNEQVLADSAIIEFWSKLQDYTQSPDLGELTRDSLLATLANFTFQVCGQHELVGSIREHVESPLHSGCRIMHNAVQVDKQSFLGGMVLLALTSVRTPPLLSQFKGYWEGNAEEEERWQNLQTELKDLATKVKARNETRPYQVQACNPEILECSVSV